MMCNWTQGVADMGDTGDIEPRGLGLDLAHPIDSNLMVSIRTAYFRLVANLKNSGVYGGAL